MHRTLRWLLPTLLAGLFLAPPTIIARGQVPHQAGPASKQIKGVHRQEMKSQRRRLKQSRKSTRAEALQSGHRTAAPKAVRHPMRHVQRKASPKNPELRRARLENRSRKKTHHHAQTN